jgi:fumarate hydratase class I
MQQPDLTEAIVELIRKTSSELPEDVQYALEQARERELVSTAGRGALVAILRNTALAKQQSAPICQDTGTLIFWAHYPDGWSQRKLAEQIRSAVAQATAKGYLRPNAVDPLTGKNSGTNLGEGFPVMHLEEHENSHLEVYLMLKGGGCENVSGTYSLPDNSLQADRDLAGIKRVVLHAIHKAQGFGCAPGIIGVGIGGDRDSSMRCAKLQLLRRLDDRNPHVALAAMETELCEKANTLGIGPMGFGGKTTVLGVKAGWFHRLPASYFVSIAYMCWADRRRKLTWRDGRWNVE